MLVLSRKPGEKILIGDNVTLTVVAVQGSRITLGIEAPSSVRVVRGELLDRADEPTIIWSPPPPPTHEGPFDRPRP
jgi:carbon storage regulator